ncbi:UBX domain-containing protein 7 isoform X1 [Octopus bimaculoides]|uniref:UBX domain-containing protein 7 isoform X1 n=2 Tax=Octopus bimaculoides TaxID=37653 RepID=UPI00071DCC4B|nr:UBX domain-containing protein 7 isoform X1 [Octopus bimaculoides]|eukprot:XP_014772020.1 PREDICTED: UBX domain-containing protein 7-like isoform X1 [Octopus bimaculoides]
MAARGKKKIVSATVDHFCSITGVTADVGERMIEACNGDLQMAVEMHMDGNTSIMLPNSEKGSTSTKSSISNNTDDVRAPIPQKREILVEDAPVFVQKMMNADSIGFRGRRPAKSVFDGFRDFQAEARQQEEMLHRSSTITSKHQTLEDLFRPPIDLIFKGTFASAREEGTNQNRWLMVNIQNVQEFACQTLNRDVWSNSAVRNIVKEHFILWQVYHDSEEGRKYMQFYKVNIWPYIAILDPQTGEKLVEWNKLDHSKFCEYAAEFLSLHPSLDGSVSPPHKSSKQEMSIVDASEDAQMQAAIKASLEQDAHSSESEGSESEYDIDLETFTGSEEESVPSPVKRIKTSERKSHGSSNLLSKLEKVSESKNKSKRVPCTQSSSSSATVYKSLTTLKSPIFSSSQTTELPCSSKQSTATTTASTTASSKQDGTASSSSWKAYLGSKDDPVTNLMIRFPDGNKQQLSLPCTSPLLALEEYVKEKGYSNEKYELITNFPRRKLSTYDRNLSLKDAGLFPQDTVFVQER